MSNFPTLTDIKTAANRIEKHIHRTSVLRNAAIDEMIGARVFFKCENFQKVGAFKARGAINAVLSLTDEEAVNGVATHSSGNHAAALALAAGIRGIPAYIVMPENAPQVKKNAVSSYGAEISYCISTLKAREDTLDEVIKKTGAVFIPPFNDYRIINGQATAALELLEEVDELDVLIAPVGGGGLLSGTALSAYYISPTTSVLGAEPKGADDAYHSLKAGMIIPSDSPKTIADGLLTSLGNLTFEIIQKHVDEIVRVDDNDIIAATRLIMERMKIVVEPSAAIALAVALQKKSELAGLNVGIILSGGNLDLSDFPF